MTMTKTTRTTATTDDIDDDDDDDDDSDDGHAEQDHQGHRVPMTSWLAHRARFPGIHLPNHLVIVPADGN